jgi:hypothetical protein
MGAEEVSEDEERKEERERKTRLKVDGVAVRNHYL